MIPKPLLLLGAVGLGYAVLTRKGRADPAASASSMGPPRSAAGSLAGLGPVVTETSPYGEPPIGPGMTSSDLVDAQGMASPIEGDLLANAAGYDRVQLAAFQRKARLTVDGLYGGRSAGALAYFLGRPSPPPLFAPFQPVTYTPLGG